ncbi:MAG: kelch-like protein [Deltaproteobacteria bacterium]|nr:kelch-like protein [Deltaproteobacteria bacterium]
MAQGLGGEWGRKAPLLEPVSEHAVAELDGKIYVIAGNTNDGGTVASVQVYDSATDSWKRTAPLSVAVNHNMAAAVNGKLYVFGGQSAGSTGSRFVDSTFEYDPAREQWRTRAPMPMARSAGATAVVNGKIYVVGGRPPRGSDFAVYDPAADTWTKVPDLPTQRNHIAAAAINGRIYVAGGRFEPGNTSPMTDALEIFDPANNQWSQGRRMPTVRGGVNGVAANGCFHVFGGEGNAPDRKGMFHEHEFYNPVTNTWTKLPDMPVPVHGVTGGAFLNGLIYLPGGAAARGGGERTNLLQTYRPTVTCR